MAHVDPWLIYVLSIVDGVKCFSWILFSVLIVVIAVLGIKTLNSYDIINYEDNVSFATKELYKKSYKVTHKYLMISSILFILSILMIMLIPSKSIIQQMIDAENGVNPTTAVVTETKQEAPSSDINEIQIIISEQERSECING